MIDKLSTGIYEDFEKHYQKLMSEIPADVNIDMPTLCFIKAGMFSVYAAGMDFVSESVSDIIDTVIDE